MVSGGGRGRVLSVASECVPLIKTGGLADVVGALPGALASEGWEVQTLLPAYRGLIATLDGAREVWAAADLFGGVGRVMAGRVGDLDLLLLDAPHLFDRPGGPYAADGRDHPDNPERFAALCWAAAAIAANGTAEGWRPDILHAHDWQAALAPAYLSWRGSVGVRSVLTIHNIAFQGIVPESRLAALRIPAAEFHQGAVEYWGSISVLKAGLVTADAITTVSPTYADELMRPEFGMGLEGVVADRGEALRGILNGVDTTVWNPETDPGISPFSAVNPGGKAENRARLCTEFGITAAAGPLAIVVSRLSHQKGIDLLVAAIPAFIAGGGSVVLLGSGDPALEAALTRTAARFPGRVGLRLGYDEALAHRMFAGADAVLVPSRFEPCGLTQMYGLRYGAVPLVAMTGGLADTVVPSTPASLAAGAATGVGFYPIDALALSRALERLLALYADQPLWRTMQKRGMRTELGWAQAATAYAQLYRSLLR